MAKPFSDRENPPKVPQLWLADPQEAIDRQLAFTYTTLPVHTLRRHDIPNIRCNTLIGWGSRERGADRWGSFTDASEITEKGQALVREEEANGISERQG